MKTNNSKYTMFAKRVATMFVAMFMGVTAWGNEWSHTFSSAPTWDPTSGTSRSMTINSATWNVETSNKEGSPSTWGTYGSAQSSGGIKFGDSKNDYYGTTTLSTNHFNSDRVSSVTVNLLINGNRETTITVAQGATTIGNPSYSTGQQWHDFTANTNLGTGGTLTLTITTTQAIFIHSIAVTYTPAPTEPQTVNFNAHGGICGTSSLDEESAGAGVELPAASANVACAAEGWAFYGWAASEVTSSTTTAPAIVGKAGDMYYPTSATTLHAVYFQESGETTTAIFNGTGLSGLTRLSNEEISPARYRHDASGIELYIGCYGYYSNMFDIDATDVYCDASNGYATIDSYGKIKQVDFTLYDASQSIGNVTPNTGTAELTTNGSAQRITCTGDVTSLTLVPNTTNNEATISSFTVTYYAVNYYSSPSCCDKIVELSAGTETNATISSFSPESVPTCGNDASREVTIVAAAATGYKFAADAELSYSGAGTATLVSATNGTAPYTWIYRLSANATGEGSFSVTSATAKNYAITLNGNGATTAGTASVNATYNLATLSAAITNPKKTDYIFQGWNTANDGSGLRVIDAAGALIADRSGYTDENGKWIKDGTAELYAEWNEHSYINYRTNCCTEYEVALANSGATTGGTFEASKTSVCEGKEVTLTATPGTGYEFDAWTVMQGETDITSTKVAGNVLTMPAGNVTVEAAFDLIEYDITYHLNGGEGATNTTYTYEDETITLPTAPTVHKTGYTFLGWYNNSSFEGDPITTIPNHSTGAIELWANWIEDNERSVAITAPTNGTITVSWNSGANSFTSGSQNIVIGTELTIEATGATGYDAGTITVNGTPLVGSTYTLDSDPLTIAASFSLHNYSITYNLNGGDGATNTTYTYESEAITLPTAPTVHKTGYTFQGWFDNSGSEGDAVTTIPNHSTGDKSFWAKWQINNYTLTWTTDGDALEGDYTGKSGKVDFGTTIVAPNTPTKTGYTFAGWYNGTSVVTPAATMPAEDVTYTATWTKNNYHVYFQNNGVTINDYTKEVAYEAQIGALPDGSALAACDGSEKVFKGWTATPISGTQKDAPDYAESTDVMGAEDLYLRAVFAAEVEGPASSPINVFATTGLGGNKGNNNHVTTGYTISAEADPQADGYYQDGSGTKRYVQVMKSNTSTAMINTTPSTVTVTATLGGGLVRNPLGNSVYAVWLDASGEELGDPVVLTNAITAAGGSSFSVNLPVVNATSAYGVRIYHVKESSYNVRYYSISLSYTLSSVTYNDYMTNCCSLVAVDNLTAIDNTSDTQVTLNWTALSAANQEGVSKLQVVDANNVVKVDNLAANAATATVTGLTQCQTYSFRVATVGAICTTYSEAVEARPFGSAKTVTFDYNYDGGTGSATSETTTCDESSVTLATPNDRSGYRFMGWYNGDDKVGDADESYTPAATVTLKAHWAQEYTLHYDYNGAAGAPDDAQYIAGETVTLPEDPTKNIMSPFQEWSFSTAVTVTDGTFPMPESNLTVTAVFGGLQGQWFLVTDESELQANDKVIIAARDYDYAMSTTQNSNNRGRNSISKKGNVIYSPADAVQIFTLEDGTVDGSWAFKTLNGTENKYICATGNSNNNYLKSEDTKTANSSFVIDIEGGKATAQGTNDNKVMRYNTSGMFACYGSATQTPIAFYHFIEGAFYEVSIANVTGGTVTSDQVFVAAGETVTLTYKPSRGYTVETLTVTGASGSVAVSPAVEAGVTEYTFTMPAEGVTVAASFEALPAVDYNLVTDADDLAVGMQFLMVAANNSNYFANSDWDNSSKLFTSTGIDAPAESKISITSEPVEEIILEGESGAWKLMQGGSQRIDKTWAISISEGIATMENGNDVIRFNHNGGNNPRFKDYSSTFEGPKPALYALPYTTYNFVLDGCKTIKVANGYTYTYTIKNTDIPNVIPTSENATYEFAGKWTDGENTYAVGNEVEVSAGTILKPCWNIEVSGNTNVEAENIVASDITVHEGSTMTLTLTENTKLGDIIVENGGTLTISGENKNVDANDFYIEAMEGYSGQVKGNGAVTVTGQAYYDLTLNTSGKMDNSKWYAFAVPFQVDAATGIQRLSNDGKTSNAGFNSHYVLLKFNSLMYAENNTNGWEYVTRGETLMPGKFYMIALNSNEYNRVRMTKKAGTPVNNKAELTLSLVGEGDHANWNALANNALAYANVSATGGNSGLKVQVYNSAANSYAAFAYNKVTFTVGTPFFLQVAEAGTMSVDIAATINTNVKAPARYAVTTEEFEIRLGANTESYYDILYVSASDEALNSYQIGHDLSKAGLSTTVPQLYVPAYGLKLCDAEFPLVNNEATFPLTFTAPSAGTYQLYLAETAADAELYLLKDGATIWNLTMGAYPLELPQGTTENYGLLLKAKAPGGATGIENGGMLNGANGVQKLIIDEKVFILRGGKMYDVTGKMVK